MAREVIITDGTWAKDSVALGEEVHTPLWGLTKGTQR